MLVVGVDDPDREDTHVHTIDMWFSRRRGCWVVERLNAHGDIIGHPHRCSHQDDAAHCLHEWLRAHAETHLVTPRDIKVAKARKIPSQPRRHAA